MYKLRMVEDQYGEWTEEVVLPQDEAWDESGEVYYRQDEIETLDEALGYDADHSDDSQYCEHGTWIGSAGGPDYMCGRCEDGD
jgi:hypothetical protein